MSEVEKVYDVDFSLLGVVKISAKSEDEARIKADVMLDEAFDRFIKNEFATISKVESDVLTGLVEYSTLHIIEDDN